MGYHSMLSAVFLFQLPEISTSPVLQDLLRSSGGGSLSFDPPSLEFNRVLVYLPSSKFEPL